MSIGAIIALVVFAGLAIWGFFLLRSKIVERRTEASSHRDAGTSIGDGSSGGGGD
jgi:hypothetical protein